MKRVLAYIVMAVVALAAFKGVAEGAEYIAENGLAVCVNADTIDAVSSCDTDCVAMFASPVTVPSSTVMPVKSTVQWLAALSVTALLLLPQLWVTRGIHIRTLCADNLDKITFPFHSFW